VVITLDSDPRRVTLVIADDGAGFDAGQNHPRPESWGLRNMHERAQAIGADLRIESAPSRGTRVIIELSRETA
jgi:signal transduction histidine kinase